MIKIKPYGPEYHDLHHQFASRHWKKRKRLSSKYIYWKFRGKPDEPIPSFVLAIDKGKVIGQLGLVPCTVQVGDEKVKAHWACDLMVDHEYRGKNIGKKLYEYAHQLRPLTLGSDASPAASKSMIKAGYKPAVGPWKFLLALKIGEVTKLKGFNSGILNRLSNPFIYVLKCWKMLRGNHIKFSEVDTNTFIPLSESFSKKFNVRVVHDSSFAAWRYTPFEGYYNGVLLFKNEANAFFSIYKSKDLFLVTEWGASDAAGCLDIISEVVTQAYRENVLKIKLLANNKSQYRMLSMAGAIKFRTRTDIIFYSNEEKITNSMDAKYFYYTYLDSDENI